MDNFTAETEQPTSGAVPRGFSRSSTARTAISVGVLSILSSASLLLDGRNLPGLLPMLYGIALSAVMFAVYERRDLVRALYSPSALMTMYVSVFFLVGSVAFSARLVLMSAADQWRYYSLEHLRVATSFFLAALAATLVARLFSNNHRVPPAWETGTDPGHRRKTGQVVPRPRTALLAAPVVMVATSLVEMPLPGGDGSFSSIFFMFAAIYLCYTLKRADSPARFLAHLAATFLLVTVFYEDRRLTVFYAFIAFFIEFFDRRNVRLRPRYVLSFAGVMAVLATAIIAMSIQRGVGDFGTASVFQSVRYVADYLRSDEATTLALHNFEAPPSFFHSHQAVEEVIRSDNYRLGSTFVKIAFLPVPRTVLAEKPRSMVDEYTSTLYPAYRAAGGSWVPNFYAEAFWNFGFLGGWLWLVVFFRLADTLYLSGIRRLRESKRVEPGHVAFLSAMAFLPFLYRGSGLDLYGLYVMLFVAAAMVITVFSPSRWSALRLRKRA